MKNLSSVKITFFTLLVMVTMVLNTNAQSKKISMQGFLKDANGKAVADGNKVLTFKIYDAQTGGTALWTNVFSTVPVSGGVYAVQLGAGKNAANIDTEISSLPWNVPYYVGITVESETELTPRTEFTYAPYTFAVNKSNLADVATRALTADAVGGGVNLAVNDSDADIRTIKNSTSPIDRNIYVGKGSGTLSSLYLYSNNDTTMSIAGGKVIAKGDLLAKGRVGIGTTTPTTAKLVINAGNEGQGLDLSSSNSYANMRVIQNSNFGIDKDLYIGYGSSGTNSSLHLYSDNVETMTVKDRLVGIGTTTPDANLEVIRSNGGKATAYLRGSTFTSSFNYGFNETTFISGGLAGSPVVINPDNGGNVGIGTLSPTTAKLVINAGGAEGQGLDLSSSNSVANMRIIQNTNSGTDKDLFLGYGSGATSSVHLYSNNVETMTVKNRYVGIGTSNPLAPLHVATTTGTLAANQRRYFVFGTDFVVDNSNTTGMSVRADGHILTLGAFIAISDKRIKNIIGVTNTATDLATLNKIEVTDYKYKDEVNNGSGLQKKVIAQQLQEVYPRAIITNQGIIPNVFAVAKEIRVVGESTIISTTKAHEFATGDKVKLVLEKTGDKEFTVTVIDATTFSVAEAINDKIFVYGKLVNDLLTVDYDAVSMLNVSATQELSKQIEQLKAENTLLQSRLVKIEALLQSSANNGLGK